MSRLAKQDLWITVLCTLFILWLSLVGGCTSEPPSDVTVSPTVVATPAP